MPSLELTIEDTSPMILYSSGWSSGLSSNDGSADLYSQSSFMLTNTAGQSASFSFNGTGVQIYGAERSNHGPYHINLDNGSNIAMNGTAADPGIFQTSLYSATGLQQGLHQVVITNDANTYLDIDFITWQTNLGSTNDNITVHTSQDTDSSFVYSGSTWATNPTNLGSFSGGSGHATNSSASFTYTFQGQGVSFFGPVGPGGSPYSVQLDGTGDFMSSTSARQFFRPQMLLYHVNNLPPGTHSVEFQCQPTSSVEQCAIDYADVYSTSSSTTSSSPSAGPTGSSASPTGNSANTSGGISVAAAAGITAACVVAFFLLLGLLGFLWFRSRRKTKVVEYGHVPRDESRSRPGQGSQATPGPEPFYLTTPPPSTAYGELVSTPSRKGRTIRMEYVPESVLPVESSIADRSSLASSSSMRTRPHIPLASVAEPADILPPGYSA